MSKSYLEKAKKTLKQSEIKLESGLSGRQLNVLEQLMGGSKFPPEYRELLLQCTISANHKRFPAWRGLLSEISLKPFLEHIFNDIEAGCKTAVVTFGGWLPQWGVPNYCK